MLNTDAQALIQSSATHRVQLGQSLTRGLGAGGNPSIGQKAAEELRADLQQALEGVDLVFIAAGMGRHWDRSRSSSGAGCQRKWSLDSWDSHKTF